MDIETLINAALGRQAQAIAEYEAEQRERRNKSLEDFHAALEQRFGDLPSILDMALLIPEGDNDADTATFTFRNRPYSIYNRSGDWCVTRMDERGEDDERRRPSEYFHTNYRSEYLDDNRHKFLIALTDLDSQPELPPLTIRSAIIVAPEPTIEQRLLDALAKFIDDRTQPY